MFPVLRFSHGHCDEWMPVLDDANMDIFSFVVPNKLDRTLASAKKLEINFLKLDHSVERSRETNLLDRSFS